ncbi:MAG: hypothetical protein J6N72_04855, partial [Psychrobacter sp.]|nr:hypothetical protein [Psychrobacter sp.]
MDTTTNDAIAMTPSNMGEEALRLGENLVSAKRINFLKQHNLRVGAVCSVNTENPRATAETIWFGMDKPLQRESSTLKDSSPISETFEYLVTQNLISTNRDINNYYCRGV